MVCAYVRIVLALGGLALAAACASKERTVQTSYGPIRGKLDSEVAAYRGIPFAAPPVGELRWRPPQPPKPWREVRSATEFAPMCVQSGPAVPGLPQEPISEDCLYLNVWAPVDSGERQHPVIVWFHGGGFRNGSASTAIYSGRELARQGVVVVNVAYRLGRLGFLAHPELTRESAQATSGNYAVLDAIAALHWVRGNIAAFGGDATRVTLMGHSAGSFMIGNLLISPLSRGLFQGVIALSGINMAPEGSPRGISALRDAEQAGVAVAREFGARSIAELRRVPAADLIATDGDTTDRTNIDGVVIAADAYSTFAAGRQHDVPAILGYASNEGANLLPQPLTAQAYLATIRAEYGELAERILAVYPARSDEEAVRSQQLWIRDHRYAWHMWTWARLQSSTGKSPVYFYNFDHSPPYPGNTPMAKWGAAHGTELLYVFRNLDQFALPWAGFDRALTDAITGYFVRFAATGDPNHAGAPAWPAFDRSHENVLRLGDPLEVVRLPDRPGLQLQDEYMAAMRRSSGPRD